MRTCDLRLPCQQLEIEVVSAKGKGAGKETKKRVTGGWGEGGGLRLSSNIQNKACQKQSRDFELGHLQIESSRARKKRLVARAEVRIILDLNTS